MNKADFIWTEEQCREAYDELMVKIAMSSYAEKQGQRLLEDNEKLKEVPQFQVTQQVKERIRRTVEKGYFRKSIIRMGKDIYKIADKVAIFFLAFSIMFGTTMVASADFRDAVYKLVFTYEKRYTLVELDVNTKLEFVDSEIYTWDHAFAPTMMPPDYTVSDAVSASNIKRVVYTNKEGRYIRFVQSDSDISVSIQVDTENAQSVEIVHINDSEGILVSKDGRSRLVWRIGNVMLGLDSDDSTEILVDIAKGIKLLN